MKKSTFFKTVAALYMLFFIPGICSAAGGIKLLSENFDYTVGTDLVSNGKWKTFQYFGIGTPATDPVKVISGGLTFPGYQPTAKGNAVELLTKGNDASIGFVPQEGVIYASMLVNVKSAPTEKGDFFFSFGDLSNITSEGYGKLHVKNIGGKLAFSVTRRDMPETTGTAFTEATYNFNQTYLVVVKFTQDPTDGKVELFIDPNTGNPEPMTPLLSNKGGSNPKLLRYVNLYQGRNLGNNVIVDAVRVATSWETLFDASEVVQLPYINVPVSSTIGTFVEGQTEAKIGKIIVKGENLTEDVTVSYLTNGYFTLASNKISKEDCMSEKGYELQVILKPKDGEVKSDKITFTSGIATSSTNASWTYIVPIPEENAQDIATILAAKKEINYTLVNPVKVTNVNVTPDYHFTYTIEDGTGSITFSDDFVLPMEHVKYGDMLTNLIIEVRSEPETPSFTPIYAPTDSPELLIKPTQSGVKLMKENFEYEVGNLAGNGNWKAYKYDDVAGGDPVKMTEGGLSYAFYQDEPIGNSVELKATGEDAMFSFQNVDGNLYSSLLTVVKSASEQGNYFYSLGAKEGSEQPAWGGHGFIFVKKVDNKLAFGISRKGVDAASVKYSEAIYDFNTPYLLVLKYNQGPSYGDDTAELFIEPKFLGAEPEGAIKADPSGMEPMSGLCYVNLYQQTQEELGTEYDVLVDAIRVATSWAALFDNKEVETAPQIAAYIDGNKMTDLYLGFMTQGDAPVEVIYNIKATGLRSDLTLSCKSEGYFTLSTTTISKEEAESENGFNLKITLNPKDGMVTKDTVRFSSELINYDLAAAWGFMGKADVNSISALKAVTYGGTYRLVNQVNIENTRTEKDLMGNDVSYYTLKDETGTVDAQFNAGGVGPRTTLSTIADIKKGDNVKKLCIMVQNINSEGGFTPSYLIHESPDLEIATSIDNLSNKAITGYANGRFTAEGATNIKIFDVNGKRLMEINGESLEMNMLPNAVYFIQYTNESGQVSTAKVMK